jgi:hypothetical protein
LRGVIVFLTIPNLPSPDPHIVLVGYKKNLNRKKGAVNPQEVDNLPICLKRVFSSITTFADSFLNTFLTLGSSLTKEAFNTKCYLRLLSFCVFRPYEQTFLWLDTFLNEFLKQFFRSLDISGLTNQMVRLKFATKNRLPEFFSRRHQVVPEGWMPQSYELVCQTRSSSESLIHQAAAAVCCLTDFISVYK